jgi:hypothetical protein
LLRPFVPTARALRERTDRGWNACRACAADDVLEAVVPEAEDLEARVAALLLLARDGLHEVEHAVDVVVVDVADRDELEARVFRRRPGSFAAPRAAGGACA